MDSVASLVLFALLIAFVGDAAASCRKVANEDMLEYFCEDGHPADLATVPETTEKLRIIRMPLHRITADTFARFGGNLWVLSCSHCEIADIDADAFRRLVNLQQLNLDSNRLTTVKASWFEGLDYLTYLDLNYNDIRDIEDGVYKNLPSLVDLRLSGNRLRCLNLDEMSNLMELKRIFLNENSDFACPHAVSKFLENQGVAFEQDPEWRRLASDTIDVHVPPSYVEEEKETVPPHRERLHPDRRPVGESEGSYATRDRTYPEHRSRHRRPTTTTMRPTTKQQEELPRVEPRFPGTRPSHTPSESPPYQVMPYPYSTPETRTPPSEDIKMSEIDEPSRTEHTLMYPLHPTHETTPHWSYPTRERSREPPMTSIPLPEDTRVTGANRPSQTERTLTYPPYIPTDETMPYPSYPTSERSQVIVIGPSEDETIGESAGRSSQAGNAMTYPLYVTTSDDLERVQHGIQVTHPVSSNSDTVTWSTDESIGRSVDLSWTQEHPEQSRRPVGGDDRGWSTRTPYYGHDPRKMIVEDPSSGTDNDVFVASDRPVGSTTTRMHYVRPSPPSELMHLPTMDDFYKPGYYESTVTVHPPLQNYQEGNGATAVIPITTEEPLPDCPDKSSAPKTGPAAALLTFIVVTVLGHVAVAERF